MSPERARGPEPPATRRCRKCPAQIVFITGPEGNPIPAQPIRSIYALQEDGTLAKVGGIGAGSERPAYVNHFETCPRADDFHHRQRAAGRGEVGPPSS